MRLSDRWREEARQSRVMSQAANGHRRQYHAINSDLLEEVASEYDREHPGWQSWAEIEPNHRGIVLARWRVLATFSCAEPWCYGLVHHRRGGWEVEDGPVYRSFKPDVSNTEWMRIE